MYLWRFKHKRKFFLLLSIFFIMAMTMQLSQILFYPSSIKIIKGENKNMTIYFPFSVEGESAIVNPIYNEGNNNLSKSLTLSGIDEGNTNLQVKLLGLIPVKNYTVDVVDRPMLFPGGNAIGVRMNTRGVLVVAVTDVIAMNGSRNSPAREAGLKVGDSILEINKEKIVSSEQVVKILNSLKDTEIELKVLRNKAEFTTKAKPIQCLQDNAFRLGIWVRDKTSGIGTMTYYHEDTNSFGALGHGITDADTGELLTVEKGLIMKAEVSDIEQGKKGTPGEIKGVFYKTEDILGEIHNNTEFGIYGNLNDASEVFNNNEEMPIGFKEEVEIGKAYILTTLQNNRIEKYEIEIQKAETQNTPNPKSMIIKVVDDRLLKETGGIVQGMSGSPIIQNGKIIGAVTHVFVNDPTKGYGLYIEWMLQNIDKP